MCFVCGTKSNNFQKQQQAGLLSPKLQVQKQTTLHEVTLDFPEEKITEYLFSHPSKQGLMESLGYNKKDASEIYNKIANNAKIKFLNGDYELGPLNINGQKVNIKFSLNGKGIKSGRFYNFVTGWTVYPNGKLHNNTPFGGWV